MLPGVSDDEAWFGDSSDDDELKVVGKSNLNLGSSVMFVEDGGYYSDRSSVYEIEAEKIIDNIGSGSDHDHDEAPKASMAKTIEPLDITKLDLKTIIMLTDPSAVAVNQPVAPTTPTKLSKSRSKGPEVATAALITPGSLTSMSHYDIWIQEALDTSRKKSLATSDTSPTKSLDSRMPRNEIHSMRDSPKLVSDGETYKPSKTDEQFKQSIVRGKSKAKSPTKPSIRSDQQEAKVDPNMDVKVVTVFQVKAFVGNFVSLVIWTMLSGGNDPVSALLRIGIAIQVICIFFIGLKRLIFG